MANENREPSFHEGGGPEYNALDRAVQYNNTGSGNQFPRAVFHGNVYFGSPFPKSSPQQLCSQSLAFLQMEKRYKKIRPATPGTCGWLFKDDIYKLWTQSNRGLLWIRGNPGAGKSTLMKHALTSIQEDKDGDNAIVLSFFFDGSSAKHQKLPPGQVRPQETSEDGFQLQKTSLGLLRSLIYQLLYCAPDTLPELVSGFEEQGNRKGEEGKKWEWDEGELQGYLRCSLKRAIKHHPIWLFIDALDEAGHKNAQTLVREFESLIQDLPSTNFGFRTCFSCRKYPRLSSNYEYEITLDKNNEEDISTFLKIKLPTTKVPARIQMTITTRASGNFLWASLVSDRVENRVDSLVPDAGDLEECDWEEIEMEINNIPEDLDELYSDILRKMNRTSMKLIRWILFAVRPLTPDELRCAVEYEAVDVDGINRHQPLLLGQRSNQAVNSGHSVFERRISVLSHGLAEVVVSSHSRDIQFIHITVKDFLAGEDLSDLDNIPKLIGKESSKANAIIGAGRTHYWLSRVCLCYLEEPARGDEKRYMKEQMMLRFPFLRYATTSWVEHTWESQIRNVPQDDLLKFLKWPSEDLVKKWVQFYRILDYWSLNRPREDTSMVHLISRCGMVGSLQAILQRADENKTDIDSRDAEGRTPLSWAAGNGYEDAVSLFLEANYGRKWSRLLLAAENLPNSLAKLPLWDTKSYTRRGAPTQSGLTSSLALVKGLFNKVNIEAKDDWGRTPFFWAAGNGHKAIVELFLATGKIDIDTKDIFGQTPFLLAAFNGHEATVRLLLDTDKVDIETKDVTGKTPFVLAALNGHETVVKLLLSTGKINLETKVRHSGRTALFLAAKYGRDAIVKLLLDTGKVDINTRDNSGYTPFIQAVRHGHEAIVRMLIDKGNVDLNDKESIGGDTPFLHAAKCGQEKVVRLLLSMDDVNIGAVNNFGSGALSLATRYGQKAVVKFLLSVDEIDVNVRDVSGQTALFGAVCHKNLAFLELLLSTNKVDINVKDDTGRTAFTHAVIHGYEAVAILLLEHRAFELEREDRFGSTPLSIAVRNSRTRVVKALLAVGQASVDSQDCFGRSVWWWARRSGNTDSREALLEYAEKIGISLCDVDDPSEVDLTAKATLFEHCDICTLDLPRDKTWHRCGICEGGLFRVCRYCYEIGGRCLSEDHELKQG